jgi:hypothetical protein
MSVVDAGIHLIKRNYPLKKFLHVDSAQKLVSLRRLVLRK